LARLLDDGDPGVRSAALEALGRLLGESEDETQRTRILDALESAGPDR
jgi:HEAT repeat protein